MGSAFMRSTSDSLWLSFDRSPVDRDEAFTALGWSLLADSYQEACAAPYGDVIRRAAREAYYGDLFL